MLATANGGLVAIAQVRRGIAAHRSPHAPSQINDHPRGGLRNLPGTSCELTRRRAAVIGGGAGVQLHTTPLCAMLRPRQGNWGGKGERGTHTYPAATHYEKIPPRWLRQRQPRSSGNGAHYRGRHGTASRKMVENLTGGARVALTVRACNAERRAATHATVRVTLRPRYRRTEQWVPPSGEPNSWLGCADQKG